jgi:hypothetical protein
MNFQTLNNTGIRNQEPSGSKMDIFSEVPTGEVMCLWDVRKCLSRRLSFSINLTWICQYFHHTVLRIFYYILIV